MCQDLLFYLAPLLRGLGPSSPATVVQALQEVEGGWGQHRLTDCVSARLRTQLAGQVREEVAREGLAGPLTATGVQEAAPRLLARLLEGQAWHQLVAALRGEVAVASRRAAEQMVTGERRQDQQELGSTWHQGSFTFLQPEQLVKLEQQLAGGEGEEGRLVGLRTLLATQLSDLVGGAAWARLVPGLRRSLGDPGAQVVRLGLAVHARLIVSGCHLGVREAALSLVETVSSWYLDRRTHSLLPSCGLTSEAPLHCSLLSCLSLLTYLARDLPRLWLRFPHRLVEEMVEGIVSMLLLPSPGRYPPLAILATLDPQASWPAHWLHTSLSRGLLLARLARATKVLQAMLASVVKYLRDNSFSYFREVQADLVMFKSQRVFNLISANVIEFAQFSFHLHFLSHLLRYRQGRALLEEEVEELVSCLLHCLSLQELASWPGPLLCSCLHLLLAGPASPPPSLVAGLSSLAARSPSLPPACLPGLLLLLLEPAMAPSLAKAPVASGLAGVLVASPEKEVLALLRRLVAQTGVLEPGAYLAPEFRHLHTLSGCRGFSTAAGLLLSAPSTSTDWSEALVKAPGLASRALPPGTRAGWSLVVRGLQEARALLVEGGGRGWPEGEEELGLRVGELRDRLMLLLTAREVLSGEEGGGDLGRLLGLGEEEQPTPYRLFLLELLTACCCNLSCLLHLQQHCGLREVVLARLHQLSVEEEVVVCQESLYWTFLEAQTSSLGGAGERPWPRLSLLPDIQLEEKVWSTGPCREVLALEQHLEQEGLRDLGWVEETGRLYREVLSHSEAPLPGPLVVGVLTGWTRVHGGLEGGGGGKGRQGGLGDHLLLEYGERMGVLEGKEEHMEGLERVQRVAASLSLHDRGYDWFPGVVYLLARGDTSLASSLLSTLPTSLTGLALWPHLSPSSSLLAGLAHCVDTLLLTERPALASALRQAHLPVPALVHTWLSQVFLNVLQLTAITDLVLTSLLLGPDYLVYLCVALLDHMQPLVLQDGEEEQEASLLLRLLTSPAEGFSVRSSLPLMTRLADSHRGRVLPYLAAMYPHYNSAQ